MKVHLCESYRGSPLSTIFGTWKKPYYAKFVLIESVSTSTNFHQKSPTCTNSTSTNSPTTTNYRAIGIKFVLVELLCSKIRTSENWLCMMMEKYNFFT